MPMFARRGLGPATLLGPRGGPAGKARRMKPPRRKARPGARGESAAKPTVDEMG